MNGRRWPPLPCLITFTPSLRLWIATPRLPRFPNGSNAGSTKNTVGSVVGRLCQTPNLWMAFHRNALQQPPPRNGRKAVSTVCFGLMNRSLISGNTCGKTLFAPAWSRILKTGHSSSRLPATNCRAFAAANAARSREDGGSQNRPTKWPLRNGLDFVSRTLTIRNADRIL
jgi:hypothetical protein